MDVPTPSDGGLMDRCAMAALCISDAHRGFTHLRLHNLPVEEIRCHIIYHNTSLEAYAWFRRPVVYWVLRAVTVLHMLLILVQAPRGVVEMPYGITFTLEMAFICVYAYELTWFYTFRAYLSPKDVFRDARMVSLGLYVVVSLLAVPIAEYMDHLPTIYAVRSLRVIPCMWRFSKLQMACQRMASLVFRVMHLILVLYASNALFAIFAFALFEGLPNFESLRMTWFNMHVMYLTTNFPDVILPAFRRHWWAPIFFSTYLVTSLYLFHQLVIAHVFNHYKKGLQDQTYDRLTLQLKLTDTAMYLINMGKSGGHDAVTIREFEQLMACLVDKDVNVDLLFDALNVMEDDVLQRREFFHVSDVMSVKMRKKRLWKKIFCGVPISVFNHWVSGYLCAAFLSTPWGFVRLTSVVVWGIMPHRWFQFIAMEVDLVLQIYALGNDRYLQSVVRMVQLLTVQCFLITGLVPGFPTVVLSTQFFVISYSVLMQQNFAKPVFKVIHACLPSILDLAGIVAMVYYVFVCLAICVFPKDMDNIVLPAPDYDLLSFSNPLHGAFTLFALQVLNNWQIVVQLYMNAEESRADSGHDVLWVLLYFVPFYLIVNMVVLNCLIAFVMDAYHAHETLEVSAHAGPHPLERRMLTGFLRRKTPGFLAVKREIRAWDVIRELCGKEYHEFLTTHGLELPVPGAFSMPMPPPPPRKTHKEPRAALRADQLNLTQFNTSTLNAENLEAQLFEVEWTEKERELSSTTTFYDATAKALFLFRDYLGFLYLGTEDEKLNNITCFGPI